MEKLATLVLISSLFTALVLLSCPAMCQEVEDESEFNYDEESERGPLHWGDINPEWRMCKNGSLQSPIDLLNERVQIVSHLGTLQMNYQPSNATLKNRGHDIKLEWLAGSSYLQINGTQYVLKQFHWHSPSEHTIDGKRLDLELHMVHETPSGQTTVIGILYKTGRPDLFLSLHRLDHRLSRVDGVEDSELLHSGGDIGILEVLNYFQLRNHLEEISESTGEEIAVGVMDPRLIKIGRTQEYYRYIGSLTTPPCTENITWTIVKEVRSASKEQIRLLRVAVHDESDTNARPLQPKNNRLVQLNKPKDDQH